MRSSAISLATAFARSTKPPYIDWSDTKNSVMSPRNSVPKIRSATCVKGFDATANRPLRAGAMSHRSSRLEKKSAIREGASRKSSAFRVGGVSTTIRSHSPVECNS